eukprot:scaffold2219_cov177-Amphora_coffeaeformis.AAC.3
MAHRSSRILVMHLRPTISTRLIDSGRTRRAWETCDTAQQQARTTTLVLRTEQERKGFVTIAPVSVHSRQTDNTRYNSRM